jgi:hypothetical protein
MSPLPATAAQLHATPSRAVGRVRAGANTRDYSGLEGERGAYEGGTRFAQRRSGEARLSRDETGSGEPLWNGPSLRATFVAQVLGQVMMDGRDGALARSAAAYAGQAPSQGRLLRRQV